MKEPMEEDHEFLPAGESLRQAVRGVDVGPWDVTEKDRWEADLIDLGGLMIPREPGVTIEFSSVPSRGLVGVAARKGREVALQLQAFHATAQDPWARSRDQFEANVRQLGGQSRAWTGRAGIELRCEVPVIEPSGRAGTQTIRVLGCGGPGWLLRGIVSGKGARAESRDGWAYDFFERTVVVPSYGQVSAAMLSPAGFAGLRPTADNQPIPLRRPD
ncbi:DUF3710 domain-containing protein [Kitasatospora sp. NPDC098652]|uniref:DUF3710 domain-containing protein n=1 Tax=Kitasatospora sp. NPDC098652 TaxID=3364095 RepID=UPI00380DAB69